MSFFPIIEVYRKAYENSSGFTRGWDDSTVYLYGIIILIVIIIGNLIESRRYRGHMPVRSTKSLFYFVCLVLALLLGLRGASVGTDTQTYRYSFENALHYNAFRGETTEPGYQLILKVLRFFLPNADCAILLFSTVTVLMVFIALWKYRDSINLYIALSFYIGLFFFQAMNLLRIYLAASFLLLNFHLLQEEQYKKYSIIILIASTFHFSSLVLFFPLLFLRLYKKSRVAALAVFIASVLVIAPFAAKFGDYIAIARYAEYAYGNDEAGKLGMMLFFEFIPSMYFIYYIYKRKLRGQWADLFVSFSMVGFVIKIISYHITIAGRLGIQFMPLYLLLVPYFVNDVKTNNRKKYPLIVFGLTIYMLVRLHIYFMQYLSKDGIMPYYTIFGE